MKAKRFLAILFLLSFSARAGYSLTPDELATCQRLVQTNARTSGQPTFAQGQARLAKDREDQEVEAPVGVSDVAPFLSRDISLFTGEEDGRGVISYRVRDFSGDGWTNNISLKVSVPFNKSQGQGVFASLSGLSGDYVLSGSFSHFMWDIEPAAYGKALCEACDARGLSLIECNLAGLQANKMPQPEIDRIERLLFGRITSKFVGAEASAGRRERAFFTPTATKDEEDRAGYSLALFGGVRGDGWSLNGRVTGKRDYREGDKVNLCTSVGSSGLESCNTLPLGEAKEVESLVAGLETRYHIRDKALVAPSAQYDFESDIWGVEAPIYVTRDSKGAFTGGIKVGWRSDVDDLSLSVFVSRGLEGVP